MTLEDLLNEKGFTVYKLSELTKIPKTTLFDIFSGKSNILDCRLKNVLKICKALDITIEEIVNLEPIPYYPPFEQNLPSFLDEDIKFMKNKRNKSHPLYDCYYMETNSSINVCEVENLISKEQANYLRKKYLK